MASLARTFASSLSNRTFNTVPASAPALKRFFSVATNNKEEEQKNESAAKQRSVGGLLNRSQVNGIHFFYCRIDLDEKLKNVFNFSRFYSNCYANASQHYQHSRFLQV